MRPFVALGVLLLAAPQAAAVRVCDDDDGSRMSLAESSGHAASEAEALPADDDPSLDPRVIVPCAFVESGVYGPLCLDASGYLITQTGVVLCEVRGLPDVTAVQAPDEAGPAPPMADAPQPPGAEGALTLTGTVVPPGSATERAPAPFPEVTRLIGLHGRPPPVPPA